MTRKNKKIMEKRLVKGIMFLSPMNAYDFAQVVATKNKPVEIWTESTGCTVKRFKPRKKKK